MKKTESLKELERRAYRSTFDDGIYDTLFGMLFMVLALVPVLASIGIPGSYGYSLGLFAALIPWLGKRYITIPRLGAVEFGPKRRKKRLLLVLICAAILFLQLPLLMTMIARGFPGSLGESLALPFIIALIASPLIVLAAYLLDYPRMYIYALVLLVGVPHAAFLYDYVGQPLNSLISFGLPGAVIIGYGLALLFRFKNKYPKPAPEASHVS